MHIGVERSLNIMFQTDHVSCNFVWTHGSINPTTTTTTINLQASATITYALIENEMKSSSTRANSRSLTDPSIACK